MLKIFVIDADAARRTQIGRALAEHDAHAEPFESLDEFEQYTPADGLILVHDRDDMIGRLMTHVERTSCLPAIAYSDAPDRVRVVRAMQAGVASYLALPLAAEEIVAEYDQIAAELPARIEKRRRAAEARTQLERLSRREHEILACMLDHGTSKAIARHLGISPRTVEAHRANLMARLDVASTSEAIRIAVEGDALGMMAKEAPERGEARP
ncbi:hypothetical protein A3736_10860 [Erythrobacter sp. HI0063]|jgi:FixJ family two-component response regulator|uniref:response regulator transcription factor n=1 Tax=Erythrobacter sp. HI0063 TaxID=1822240 RepID=UPI0007C37C96|nr:LuxR C-terminal-related transcriptional regulator [Erythrobacter sp. HI0063]KZY55453.1 hypothetical protein A3736_10860 [Erythrobacter sp. HI0063]